MKFAIDSNHRDFFQKNHVVEFDGLLNEKMLMELKNGIEQTLTARIDPKHENPENIFLAGRDLWRNNVSIKKIAIHRKFAEIASELITYKPLRLGFDQYFPPAHQIIGPRKTPYALLMNKSLTLNEYSTLQGVLCGLMLCTQAPNTIEAQELNPIFPATPGNGVFFNTSAPIDFQALTRSRQGFAYYMVVYVHATSVYILNDNDPHTHESKKYGYVFGDKLSDKSNPIVYR